jgi:uncharacterized membrane protein YgcG
MKLDKRNYCRRHFRPQEFRAAATAAPAPNLSSAATTTTAKLPRIGHHYCSQVSAARTALQTRVAPLDRRYESTLLLLARTTDRRVRAQINRQLKSMRLERESLLLRQAEAVTAALPSVGSYFDELQRRNAGERGGSSNTRDLANFFGGGGSSSSSSSSAITAKRHAAAAAKQKKLLGSVAAQTPSFFSDTAAGVAVKKEAGIAEIGVAKAGIADIGIAADDVHEDEDAAVADDANEEAATTNEQDEARRAARKRLHQAYWNAQPNRPVAYASDYVIDMARCGVCGRGEMVHQEDEGMLQCNNPACANFIPHIVDTHRMSHSENGYSGGGGGGRGGGGGDVNFSAYQRHGHFKEFVAEFEAVKGAVPDEVFAAVGARMAQERLRPEDLNYATTRGLLTRLHLSNKHLNHVNRINAHFGVRPPALDPELREALFRLFDELQLPWSRLSANAERNTNVFNYNYVLYQLLKLLGQDHLMQFTSLEADRDGRNNRAKQLEQDARWRVACAELDWVFFPTV